MAVQQEQSQGSSGAGNAGGTGGGAGGGDKVDVNALMADYQTRLEQTSGALEQSTREISGLKQKTEEADQTFSALRKALGVKTEEDPPADPYEVELEQYQREMDSFLQAAIEADRAGRPIPLTARSAINSLQGLITKTKQLRDISQRFDKVSTKVDRLSDPNHQIDQQAFASMDGMVMSALNTIYGNDESTKAVQFKSVTGLVGQEIRAMLKKDPQIWDRIRRNPADQQKLVKHFVEQTIPPAARKLLEDDQIRRTPLTVQDLWAAWQDTKAIEDPAERARTQELIRPQLLERIYNKNRGERGGKGINGLF